MCIALSIPGLTHGQARGLPIVNTGIRNGGMIAADVGFGNEASGTGTTLGATATTGMGFLAVGAMLSRGTHLDNTVWSQAVAVSLGVVGGSMSPFRVTMQAGAGHWAEGIVETVRFPVSLGISGVIPIPGLSLRPWLAPRMDHQSTTFENSDVSGTELGLSGGIELTFLNGLTIRSAYDRLFVDGAPGVFSIGAGFSLGR